MSMEASYQFMENHRSTWSIEKMAKTLEVSRSGYYAWRKRGRSVRERSNDDLVARIRTIQRQHKNRYGSPRVYADLRKKGFRVGRKRVARLMSRHGLGCQPSRRFRPTTDSRHSEPIADNILARQFEAAEPNTAWVSDITYIPTAEGWLYLCVVIDLFDRMVVGWSMRTDLSSTLVIDAFTLAVARRRPKGRLIFHSDRGIQYCSMAFRNATTKAVPLLVRSMSRKGNCWDNACAESFFKTMKRELSETDGWATSKATRLAVYEYIEAYYNRVRIHSRNGFKPPVMVKRKVA